MPRKYESRFLLVEGRIQISRTRDDMQIRAWPWKLQCQPSPLLLVRGNSSSVLLNIFHKLSFWCIPTISTYIRSPQNNGKGHLSRHCIVNTLIVSISSSILRHCQVVKNSKAGNVLICRANSSSWLYLGDKRRCWIYFQIFAERW